jgi:hypothetical protein
MYLIQIYLIFTIISCKGLAYICSACEYPMFPTPFIKKAFLPEMCALHNSPKLR